jgi:hypothetical protein
VGDLSGGRVITAVHNCVSCRLYVLIIRGFVAQGNIGA